MRGFFSRGGEASRRELRKEPSRARRFMAPLYVLVALAGFGLVAFASTPRLTPPTLGFIVLAAGLLLSGLADLGAGRSPRTREALRLTGFLLGVLGLLTVVLSAAASRG